MGGYSPRRARGSQNWSYHASGLALDFNYAENGMVKPRPADAPEPTDMPLNGTGSAMEALAAKHGLGWGGAWNRLTDSMHFSAAKPEFGYLDWPRNGVIPGAPEQPPENPNGEVEEVPYDDAILRRQRAVDSGADPDANDPRGTDQRAVSGTQSVSTPQTTTTQNTSVDDQRAARTASSTPTTAEQRAQIAQTGNAQGSSPNLRPYYPINAQDDRYDFNTGDKIRAILAARNQR